MADSSVLKRTLILPPLMVQRKQCRRGSGKNVKPEDREKGCEIPSPEHDHRKHGQSGSANCVRPGLGKMSAMGRGGATQLYLFLLNYGATDGFWRWDRFVFSCVPTGKPTRLQ